MSISSHKTKLTVCSSRWSETSDWATDRIVRQHGTKFQIPSTNHERHSEHLSDKVIPTPTPPRLSFPAFSRTLCWGTKTLRRKTLVTRNGDSPFWGPVISSGYSEKYKHVFGSKNPGVNVTCVRMFSQLRCRGGLRFGCGPCWWVNISSRLICVTDSGPMMSASRPVWDPWTRALFSAVKHSPSAGSRCFLYRICLPLVVVPTLVLFLIHAFHCPHGLREALL